MLLNTFTKALVFIKFFDQRAGHGRAGQGRAGQDRGIKVNELTDFYGMQTVKE
jgi:hypothetical protein